MRYLCVHGHFYQPPRENPWLEAIELQDSAHPYHDWNERITAECYAPNGASRILDRENRIVKIVNNYASMSYNFGPTLLSWLKDKAPGTYRDILAADRASSERFSGHGSAMAQCYNHMIMPLANSRDKFTQVYWGIQDFRHRYQRDPEGMWLPETAVDIETLDLLAEHGIRYTVLAPSQAGTMDGEDVTGQRIDPTRAYLCKLPSGRTMNLFFYDGPISRAVAFEGLLNNGEQFARRLLDSFSDARDWAELGHIATDGETYGHHHRYGEMALTFALEHIERSGLAKVTNYAEYLGLHPPTHEVEILENTAWSCVHGVGRWNTNCGCNSGGNPDWNQEWRAPLRQSLDWLRDEVAKVYVRLAARYLKDPWAARNDYINVILDRHPDSQDRFVAQHFRRKNAARHDRITVWKLLEIQRHAMLMYTSCGWFFDELSGIETVQVMQYAARVVQLAQELSGESFEQGFTERLALAKSNDPDEGDGANIYAKLIKNSTIDFPKVGAHYAVSSLFESYPETSQVYCYRVDSKDYRTRKAGKMRIASGKARLTSEITQESEMLMFAVLHFGDHNVHGGIAPFSNDDAFRELVRSIRDAFGRSDLADAIHRIDEGFRGSTYSLKNLFRDEQRRVMGEILKSPMRAMDTAHRQLFENQASLIAFMSDCRIPIPKVMKMTAEVALNGMLLRALEADELDSAQIQGILEDVRSAGAPLDTEALEIALRRNLERRSDRFFAKPHDVQQLQDLSTMVAAAVTLPLPVVLWSIQNQCYELLQKVYPEMRREGQTEWVRAFEELVDLLRISPIIVE
jgi:alpha-amylase/alpha-mannosidase (GH57 family)